jgi:hypothetical protein
MVDVFLEHYYAVVMIESDEDEYSFRDEKNHQGLYLTYLGGTPLVYVTESEWATWCRPCSPCVPGAGDLDSPMPEDDSVETALCMCPEDMQFLANANGETYYIFELDNPETVLFIEPQKEMEGELLR